MLRRISGYPALGSRQLASTNSCHACSLSSDEPESSLLLERHSVTCAFGMYRHYLIHNGLVLQLFVAIIKEAGFPGDSISIKVELRGMRPLMMDDTRPGELVALDINGDGHHLVI